MGERDKGRARGFQVYTRPSQRAWVWYRAQLWAGKWDEDRDHQTKRGGHSFKDPAAACFEIRIEQA